MSSENIWIAASDGDLARVTQLLQSGQVSVNAQDENGYAPLHAAASYGHVDLVRYLLANGADVNLADSDGDTPLLYCEDGETFTALWQEVLRRSAAGAGAVPATVFTGAAAVASPATAPHPRNIRNAAGQNVLDKAAEDDNEEFVSFLLSSGHFQQADLSLKARRQLGAGAGEGEGAAAAAAAAAAGSSGLEGLEGLVDAEGNPINVDDAFAAWLQERARRQAAGLPLDDDDEGDEMQQEDGAGGGSSSS